jgi:hypothetical protein
VNISARIAGILSQIRTEQLPNGSQQALKFEPTCSAMKFIELSTSVEIEGSETKGTPGISSYTIPYYPKLP